MSLSLPDANDIESWRRLGDGLHRLTWNGKPALLKRRARAPEDFFRAEERGLIALRETCTLSVPEVYMQGGEFLLLQDLGSGHPQLSDWRTAGERLAALHARSACPGMAGAVIHRSETAHAMMAIAFSPSNDCVPWPTPRMQRACYPAPIVMASNESASA